MSRRTNQAFNMISPAERQISHNAPAAWLLHFQTLKTAEVAKSAAKRFTMVMGCMLSSLINTIVGFGSDASGPRGQSAIERKVCIFRLNLEEDVASGALLPFHVFSDPLHPGIVRRSELFIDGTQRVPIDGVAVRSTGCKNLGNRTNPALERQQKLASFSVRICVATSRAPAWTHERIWRLVIVPIVILR